MPDNNNGWETGEVQAQFYEKKVKDNAATELRGEPVYTDGVYLRKSVAGDRFNSIDRPMRSEDVREHPSAWDLFQRQRQEQKKGTPLSKLDGVGHAEVDSLGRYGIHTVEALAALPNEAEPRLGPLFALRASARAMTKYGAGPEDARHAQQLAEKDAALEDLRRQLAAVQATQSQDDKKKVK